MQRDERTRRAGVGDLLNGEAAGAQVVDENACVGATHIYLGGAHLETRHSVLRLVQSLYRRNEMPSGRRGMEANAQRYLQKRHESMYAKAAVNT